MGMQTKSMIRSAVIAVVLVAMSTASPTATAQEASGPWRQTLFGYGMGVVIDGEAQAGPVAVDVDLSISDLFDALDFGAMAAYRVENDTWSFTADATYMKLGWSRDGDQGRAGASLDTDQLTVMATLGRRVTPNLEVLFSLAYFDLSADLQVRVLNQTRVAERDADWVDPMIGLHYRAPLAGKWAFSLRGDVGGFGVGSDLTLHGWATLVRQNTEAFSWFFGYRFISYDYETGSGLGFERYDLQQHGPGIGVAWSF
jgi:hypothetical protein